MCEVTDEGKTLVERWRTACKRATAAQGELVKAQIDLQTAEERLATWLLPGDAKEGEQFCVWYGDSLISAKELADEGRYEVSIRKHGKSLMI